MPKIEITTNNDNPTISEETYKKALTLAQMELAQKAEEIDKLKENLRIITKDNQTLRVANQELQEYIIANKQKESQKASQNVSEYAEEDVDNCDGDCENCEYADHDITEDTEVDIEIDRLIRENLDLEGRLKGMEDALHIALAWIKYNPDIAEGK